MTDTQPCGLCGQHSRHALIEGGVPYCHVDRGLGPYEQTCYEIAVYRALAARNAAS